MTHVHAGGCACGVVRYRVAGDPLFVANCFCRDCQRAGGGAMATIAAFPASAFELVGRPDRSRRYVAAGGGGLDRHFCGECGGRLYTDNIEAMPGTVLVAVGSLDEAGAMTPGLNIFTASAQPWAPVADHLPSFPGMPPG